MPSQLAVIFDIDGVLVASYEAHFRSWPELALPNSCSKSSPVVSSLGPLSPVRTWFVGSRTRRSSCWPPSDSVCRLRMCYRRGRSGWHRRGKGGGDGQYRSGQYGASS